VLDAGMYVLIECRAKSETKEFLGLMDHTGLINRKVVLRVKMMSQYESYACK